MDEASVRAALECYWRYAPRDQEVAHAMYHDDAVLEFPQSEERFEGKANFIAWRSIYPAFVTTYYAEGWQAPQWRAPWRAAWPSDSVP